MTNETRVRGGPQSPAQVVDGGSVTGSGREYNCTIVMHQFCNLIIRYIPDVKRLHFKRENKRGGLLKSAGLIIVLLGSGVRQLSSFCSSQTNEIIIE